MKPLLISLTIIIMAGCAPRPLPEPLPEAPPVIIQHESGQTVVRQDDGGYERLRRIAAMIGRNEIGRAYNALRRWVASIDKWLDGQNPKTNSNPKSNAVQSVEQNAKKALEELDNEQD